MNKSAFNLQITNHSSGYPVTLEMGTYSTRENWYVIHPCSLLRNVSMSLCTFGIALAALLDKSLYSDLFQSGSISSFNQNTQYTYLNSWACFPYNASFLSFMVLIFFFHFWATTFFQRFSYIPHKHKLDSPLRHRTRLFYDLNMWPNK